MPRLCRDTRGGDFVALSFLVGNFAFQIDREISHAKFSVLREFLAHQQYTLWTLAGGTTQNPGGSAKLPTAEFTTAKFDLARNPPPPPRPVAGVFVGEWVGGLVLFLVKWRSTGARLSRSTSFEGSHPPRSPGPRCPVLWPSPPPQSRRGAQRGGEIWRSCQTPKFRVQH